MRIKTLLPALAVFAATSAVAESAWCQACDSLPNPVYGLGANAVKPLFKNVGRQLAGASTPQTIVYQSPGQCSGINGLLAGSLLTGTASWWNDQGVEGTCTLPIEGTPIEFAAMNSYATLCPGVEELPDGFGDFLGPIQSFDFIVPKGSSQTSISAAGAYFVYGFGTEGEAEPWVDETQIIKRDPNSGVSLFVALAIGVPVEKLKGVDGVTNSGVVALVSQGDTQSALGIVSGEVAQANNTVVTSLAYQHYDQECGYYPNSTETSLDKRNIRDGHYWIWSPIHFFAEVDDQGVPVIPGVEQFIGYFTGAVEPPDDIDIVEIEIASGTIPECAMTVRRSGDLADLESFLPEEPCGCYFEFEATGETECEACEDNDGCPSEAPNCRFGFCEVN